MLENLRVAVVHEWLVDYSGSERVLEQILRLFPQADLFAVVDFLPATLRFFIQNKSVTTTAIQHLPFASQHYRQYLPLMPIAVEQLDLAAYDLVISSSHAVAKGVLTGPDQVHISYVHSPMRYAWDLQHQYLKEAGWDRGPKSWPVRWVLHQMRLWDTRTANGVDAFVANSQFIARRIWKVYRREATTIYPPVDVEGFTLGTAPREDFYLVVSRFVPYKKVDLIVATFSGLGDRPLVVIGDGPGWARVRAQSGKNVTLLGFQPTSVVRDYMQRAQALVFAAEEDFGITLVEAQACGTPAIAYGKGGALEILQGETAAHPTGVFFQEQTPTSLKAAIEVFEGVRDRIAPVRCRENAMRFAPERFRDEFAAFVRERVNRS